MAEDRLPADDRRYFAVPSRRRVVGVLGQAYYLETALSPEGGGGFRPVEIWRKGRGVLPPPPGEEPGIRV